MRNCWPTLPWSSVSRKRAGNGANACAPGIANVFHERRSQGKFQRHASFLSKRLQKFRASIHSCRCIWWRRWGNQPFPTSGSQLGRQFSTNWARCLVAAMTKAPTNVLAPFLFLDEFNKGTTQDLQGLNRFMCVCQNLGFHLIIVTSEKTLQMRS